MVRQARKRFSPHVDRGYRLIDTGQNVMNMIDIVGQGGIKKAVLERKEVFLTTICCTGPCGTYGKSKRSAIEKSLRAVQNGLYLICFRFMCRMIPLLEMYECKP